MSEQPKMVDTVSAYIGGRQMRIGIQRHAIGYLETDISQSAFAVLSALLNGTWNSSHVVDVLRFAMRKQPSEGMPYEQWELKKNLDKLQNKVEETPVLDDAIREKGVGTYAVLASMVLSACLFGLKEDEATFTDQIGD